MKVRFRTLDPGGWTRDVDMPAVPRVGDHVRIVGDDYDGYVAQSVIWYPGDNLTYWDAEVILTVCLGGVSRDR